MKLLTQTYTMDTRGPDKNRSILGLKIATFIVAVLLLFHKDFATLAVNVVQSESSYMLAVPFLFAYLIYRKRKMLRAVMPLESQAQPIVIRYLAIIVGVLLATIAILLCWYGSKVEYHMLTLPIFAAGLTLILFNTQTLRELAFPLAFLILLTPPSGILSSIGPAFSSASSEASYAFIRAIGIPSTLTNQPGNPPVIQVIRSGGEALGFTVGISSSGLYSLLGFLVFAIFISYTIRDKLWKKLLIFPVGFSIIYVLSITRIATILLIGYNFGRDIAMELFLLMGGWILIFLGTFLVLAFSEKALHTQIFSRSPQECPKCSGESRADQDLCFSCGRILNPSHAKFHNTDIVKVGAIIAALVLLTEPIAAWWGAATFLSQRSLYLAVTTCALLPEVMILYVLETRGQKRADAEFYQKLSMGNRQVIDTVRETERVTRPTLNTITAAYESKTGEPIAYQEMLRRLSHAERTGIIEPEVGNVHDEPTQVWRSHLKLSEETDAENNSIKKQQNE